MVNRVDVIVVGGGASGLMTAGLCAQQGLSTLLIERNERLGKKLLITGKGRCNVTNNCEMERLIESVPSGGRFLFSAFSRFSPQDVMAFFEELGVPLKTERGARVFPQSDKAGDIVSALERLVKQGGCRVETGRVRNLVWEDGTLGGVQTEDGRTWTCRAMAVCTGGKSYPRTGSTGDGYALAKQAGHTVTALSPSLVPLVTKDDWCAGAQGLSLRNVALAVTDTVKKKQVYSDFGEMLFTHYGMSGPMVLSASAHMRPMSAGRYEVAIDLKPALGMEQLDARVQRDFLKYQNRDLSNSLGDLLPRSIIPVIIEKSCVPGHRKINQITREERRSLCCTIKHLTATVQGFRPIEEAIVTSGGVSLKEVSPKTMESKLVKGLYFAGEVLDLDAYTGGFNLQIAFSTAYAAAQAIREVLLP
ncbi:NAD(P)/FAD-dependent oxidoreductase [[Clostridium] leptum]|nr:NAD(P)/FAD-dependent oxidoreductase [[Clostridium] leptum]